MTDFLTMYTLISTLVMLKCVLKHSLAKHNKWSFSSKFISKCHFAIDYLKHSKKLLILITFVAIISVSVSTFLSVLLSNYGNYSVPSLGYIKTIDVKCYWDPNGETETNMISWDTLVVGSSNNVTLFIKSVSNYDVLLTYHLSDWEPVSIANYLVMSWDYNGTVIEPGEIIGLTFTLSAPASNDLINYLIKNDISSFSHVIHVVAVEI